MNEANRIALFKEEGLKEVNQITWAKVGLWIRELYERVL